MSSTVTFIVATLFLAGEAEITDFFIALMTATVPVATRGRAVECLSKPIPQSEVFGYLSGSIKLHNDVILPGRPVNKATSSKLNFLINKFDRRCYEREKHAGV